MSRHRFIVFGAVFALLVGALAPTTMASGPQAGKAGIHRLDTGSGKLHLDLLAANRDKQVTAIVTMVGKPLSLHIADAKSHGKSLSRVEQAAIVRDLKAQQAPTITKAKGLGGKINETYQAAISGFSVQIAAIKVPALRNLPGVTSVQLAQKFTLDNERSVPFIGAPQAWQDYGLTGTGVKIADIDTGIDYYHANFGGSGDPNDFANDNSTIIEPGTFPTAKVIGGYDFVGDAYNADTPHPDPDPLDCNGHGSHTAGTAAGDGVLSDGSTFTGPYNNSTVSSHTWNIGPGVAPQASILAYRVFGCEGSANDDVIIAAIDQAVVDGADVINMSLGAPFGTNDDADSQASNNASAAGVTVVASAGNSGPSGYITGNPSTATSAISVAAIDGGYANFPGATLSNPAITAINANGATFSNGLTVPIKVLYTGTPHDAAHISLGCDPAEYSAAGVTGDLVVVQRGTCARVARAIYGQKAGAAAVLMVNNADTYPPYEGKITSNPDTGEQYTVTIPFLGVPSSNAAALVAADGQNTTLNNTTIPSTTYKTVASFSSGGPRNGDSALKPDIAAPGVSTVSTAVGTGTGGTTLSGTSMAAPHVTGSAALVVQAHPTWTPEQIKAALMGTASISSSVFAGTYNPRTLGAGVVQPRKAVDTTLYATTGANTSSLSFGEADLLAASNSSGTVTFHNTGSSSVRLNLSGAFAGSSLGASLALPTTVTVPAHGTANAMVQLKLASAAVKSLPGAETSTFGTIVTIRGAITATPAASGVGLYALRIPFMVVPRGLSIVHPTTNSVNFGTSSSAPLGLINDGKHDGNADFYALGQTSPNDGLAAADIHATGVQTLPGSVLDGAAGDRSLFFAINNYGKWNTPSQYEFDVFIDRNHDGNPDAVVVGFDYGDLTTGTFDGRFAAFVFQGLYAHLVDIWVADAPMNSSSLLLPTLASEVGITSGTSSFRYAVQSTNLWTGDQDATGWANFDAFTPPVSTGDYIGLTGGHTATDTLTINRSSLGANPVGGWLIQTMDDAADSSQADIVNLTYTP